MAVSPLRERRMRRDGPGTPRGRWLTLQPRLPRQRKAQWRLDFVAAENSMGFHAPQEAARILGEAADYARQGQIAAIEWLVEAQKPILKDKP